MRAGTETVIPSKDTQTGMIEKRQVTIIDEPLKKRQSIKKSNCIIRYRLVRYNKILVMGGAMR